MPLPNGKSIAEYARLRRIVPNQYNTSSAVGCSLAAGGISSGSSGSLTPEQRKYDIITAMMVQANFLSDRENRKYPNQIGIAYSYGSKQYDRPEVPSLSKCPTPINGLDCSGFLYQCALNAKLKSPPSHTGTQSSPGAWDGALAKTGLKFKLSTSAPSVSQVEQGDIIAWPGHIGLVGFQAGELKKAVVYQSNGYVGPQGCDDNRNNPKKGVHAVPYDKALTDFGKDKSVNYLRLVVKDVFSCTGVGLGKALVCYEQSGLDTSMLSARCSAAGLVPSEGECNTRDQMASCQYQDNGAGVKAVFYRVPDPDANQKVREIMPLMCPAPMTLELY